MKKYLLIVVIGDGPPYYWHTCIEENNQIYLENQLGGRGGDWHPNYYLLVLPNDKFSEADIKIVFVNGTVKYLFTNDSIISISLHGPVEQLLTSHDFTRMEMGLMENGSDAVLAFYQNKLGNSIPTSPYPIKPIRLKTINYKIEGKLIIKNIDTVVINSSGILAPGNWQGNWQGKKSNTGF
jgi:hypothetical protein